MYPLLFTPTKIKNMELKNRLVVPPMVTQFCERDGKASHRFIAYHEAKAKGGWGLIIPENYAIDQHGGAYTKLPGLWHDEQIESHRQLTDRVHRHGAKICCQIYHAGRATHPEVFAGQAVGPSAIKDATRQDLPRALTTDEIHAIADRFGDAALRAKQAGFDMVEIHGAHGYLIAQFLSPFSNKRTDEYGGSLHNRCRFLLEVIGKVRAKVGEEYPVQLRISTVEYVEGGLDLAQSMAIAQLAEAAGVDSIHASQGTHVTVRYIIPPHSVPRAAYVDNAAAIKSVVSIPVIAVGRINEPMVAEAVLKSGKADLVSMGRASIADPEMPNKAREGCIDDITYCIACVQGCFGENERGCAGIRCLVNPRIGHEWEPAPVTTRKKVLVAGGGITGCEAAIIAAQNGHDVSLWEAGNALGGQWALAAMPPGKTEFQTFLFWQRKQLEELGVPIHLNTAVTEALLRDEAPDVLLVATGSTSITPHIPGIESAHVVQAADVLAGRVPAGRNVAVIGGGLVGAETADYVTEQGFRASIIEMLPEIAKDGEIAPTFYLLQSLREKQVDIFTGATCKEIAEDSVLFEQNGELRRIEQVDQVIIAVGARVANTLQETGETLGIRTLSVGDAAGVKNGLLDVWEAYDVAMSL